MAEEDFDIADGTVVPNQEPTPDPVGLAGPPLAQNTEHETQALNARMADYRGLPRFQELIRIVSGQIQELEDVLWSIALDSVETAVGTQLDGFGSIVGAERQGLSDDDYRALIRATILANNSEGTIPDLYAIVLAALDTTATGVARIEWKGPAGFLLHIIDPPAFTETILHGLVVRGTAGGVRGITLVSSQPAGTRLRFTDASNYPTSTPATGLEDVNNNPGVGGTMVAAYDERTGG